MPGMIPTASVPSGVEYPPKADLRKEIYRPLPYVAPGTIDPAAIDGDALRSIAEVGIEKLDSAIASNDVKKLADCFYTEQAFWRDAVALTSHLRTFTTSETIAAALLQTVAPRGLIRCFRLEGEPHLVVLNPVMIFIDCGVSFQTRSPALNCSGRLVLWPAKSETNGSVEWKVWILSTWSESLSQKAEDESLLSSPGISLDEDTIEIDVFIVGAGSSGLTAAARLKALGINSVIIDQMGQVGDNWAQRYDCLDFHVPTSSCELPFAAYGKELQSPHRLTKNELAEHFRKYAAELHLNIILSTTIVSTVFDPSASEWTIQVKTDGGSATKTVISKHFIQATGIGSGKPYLPEMESDHLYGGISVHSTRFRNAQVLAEQGVKSVAVIGSANTAFDIMRDCYHAGLETTMVARSPTSIFPYDYLLDPNGIGAYEKYPLDIADRMLNTLPLAVDGQFSHGLLAHLASQEPDRYLGLRNAGFPVLDGRDPSADVQHHLIERAGGHYVDVGGTDLIAEGKVAVRGLVEPVAFTETGLRLSDGSKLDADAIIWCTGFADKDVRATAVKMLGGINAAATAGGGGVLGPEQIASRLDATWGVDAEGEVRGMWKRHLRMDNYWVMGGHMQHQRWWSRALAQQIKLALDGTLPPAYRDTPK